MSAVEEKERLSGDLPRPEVQAAQSLLPTVNPDAEKTVENPNAGLHPAFYVTTWIALSSSVILFNKKILHPDVFPYPILLTTWHLIFGTLMTQVLARTTTLLDGRKKVKMTGRVYLRAIVPIGVFFSLSLMCGNYTYLYLSVAFIQMLKATTPVAVLLATWGLGLKEPNLRTFLNVSVIVVGVIIASFGEFAFVLTGFIFQMGGIAFEATRLVMVERLLSSAEFKMDPLVSFYYFAPVCAIMNFVVSIFFELPYVSLADFDKVGYMTLLLNASIAFCLNVSVVFLIGKTSSLVMTLCGVLKDILLVAASVFMFGTPVTALQLFGYSIAIAGLMYHKLGADKLKSTFSDANRKWAEYGASRPAQRKVVIFALAIVFLFVLLGGLGSTVGYDTSKMAAQGKEMLNGALGNQNGQ